MSDAPDAPDAPAPDAPAPSAAAGGGARTRGWARLASWAIDHPVGTWTMALILGALGLVLFTTLRIDLLPQVVYPVIRVSLVNEGADPQVLEETGTRELEKGLAATENVTRIESTTREGRSSVLLEFDYSADVDAALADASANLDQIRTELPEEAEAPTIFKIDPSASPVIELAITSEALDLVRLRDFAEEELADLLITVPGVAAVTAVGGREREIVVTLDPARLRGLGLSVGAVLDAIGAENQDVPGGRVTTGRREVLARTEGEFETVEELAEVAIPLGGAAGGRAAVGGGSARRDSAPTAALQPPTSPRFVRLRDIGTVRDASDEQRIFARLNREPAVKLSIEKQPTANTTDVIDAVRARLDELKADGTIPPNITIAGTNDQSVYIRDAVSGVSSSALLGGGLAILVIAFFLASWRQTLVILVTMPLVVLITFLLMRASGITLNLFSLGGLALGIGQAVDSAIVVLENITRKQREARGSADAGGEPAPAGGRFGPAYAAVQEVTSSVVAGTAANLASVLPFLLVSGLAALLFRELILVITYSTIAAVLLALTLVPTIAARLNEPEPDDPGGGRLRRWSERLFRPARRFNEWIAERYAAGLTRLLGRRGVVVLVAAALFGGAVFVARTLGTEFLPQFDDGRAEVQIRFAAGTALEEANDATEVVERVIARMPSVGTQFAVAGGRLFSRAALENSAESRIDIQLDVERELTTEEWIAQLRQRLRTVAVPGGTVVVRKSNVRGLGGRPGGEGRDIEFILAGDDLARLTEIADEMVVAARGVPGLSSVEKSVQDGVPEYRVEVDRERAASLGVTSADIGEAVRVALDGVVASTFTDADAEYDIRVRMDRGQFTNAGDLEALPVGALGGVPLPLGAVARIRESTGPVEIQREDQTRVIRITGDASGSGESVGEVTRAAEARLRGIALPEGYRLTVGGEAEEAAENQRQLLLVLLMAVLLVFAVMAVQYESVVNPLVIMVTVPLALTGVVGALWATGTPLSAPVLLGVVLLAGIVVNNGIILIEYVEELRARERASAEDAVVQAGRLRLRPILMTAVTALVGSLPLALGLEKGGETLRPLAIAFVGGLGVATLLTLFVVPSLYLLAHGWRDAAAGRLRRWRERRRGPAARRAEAPGPA